MEESNMALMKFEEVMAVGIRKGDIVRFQNTANTSRWYEGEVISKRVKSVSGGRYFDPCKNAWMDAAPVKRLHITIRKPGERYGIVEDQFHVLEIVERRSKKGGKKMIDLIKGQSAEELNFCWSLKDLQEFAKCLDIKNRSKMSKIQLAMAIEESLK